MGSPSFFFSSVMETKAGLAPLPTGFPMPMAKSSAGVCRAFRSAAETCGLYAVNSLGKVLVVGSIALRFPVTC